MVAKGLAESGVESFKPTQQQLMGILPQPSPNEQGQQLIQIVPANVCPRCCKSFTFRHNLIRHYKTACARGDTNRDNFKCNVCQKMFSRKDGLKKHRLTAHPDVSGSDVGE